MSILVRNNVQKKIVIFLLFNLLLISFMSLFLINTANAAGTDIYVDDDNIKGPWDGTSEHPFRHIKDGIDAVLENGTVIVLDGIYNEKIILVKTIKLIGSKIGKTIIDGGGDEIIVALSVDNVTIQGFTIKNATYGIKINKSNNSIITENTIRETNNGIYINNSFNNKIYNNNFVNNTKDAYDTANNIWYDDVSHVGNYWDKYTGIDTNNDGIGDASFDIAGGSNKDEYPFTQPLTEKPIVSFTYMPLNPTTQDSIKFNDSSYDTDGNIVSWNWSFGDGSNSNKKSPEHRYIDNGLYTMSLKIIDDLGALNESIKTITVSNVKPIASFNYTPDNPNDLQNITFNDTSEDLDGDIVFWNWNFGDKNSSSLQNPNHKYDDNGLYIVTLNVTDDDKATTSISKEIEVLNVKPSANFWYNPSSPNINDTLQYTDNSIDPDGTIVSWSWDFGNGVKSNEQSPTHKYTSQGTYKVSLTVTDNDGDLNTKIINVRIFDLSTPSKEYSGFIIIFIVFLIMLVLMMFFVFWIKKKEK